jgi:O-antigen/teichoic acid export membrane protein
VIGPASIRRSFFSSLRSHAVARVTQAAIALVLVPYVLSHLSRAEYGLWSWLLAMAAWLTVVDLGLSLGNVNPLARGLAEGEHRRVGQILVAALAFQGSIVLAIVVVVITAREPLLAALPPAGRAIGVLALLPLVVAQGLVVLSFPFGALLSALQRLDLVHKIQTVLLVTQALATIVILESGGRVVALAWLQCVLGASQLVARAVLCRRLYPALRPARPERGDLPRLLGMGVPVAVLGFVGGIALNFERTFLGFVVDLALLAQYAVAVRLVMAAREIPLVLVSALIPASAALDVTGDERTLARLYGRSFKAVVAVVLALAAVICVAAPAALAAWLGPGFEAAGRVARPLALAILVPLVTAPGIHVLTGRSQLGRLAPLYLAWGAAFVVANALWLSATGFAGAGWGACVVNLLGTAALLVRLHREIGLAGQGAVLFRGALAALAAAGAGEVALLLLAGGIGVETRLTAALVTAGAVAVVGATHFAVAWASGLLDADDRRQLADALGFR